MAPDRTSSGSELTQGRGRPGGSPIFKVGAGLPSALPGIQTEKAFAMWAHQEILLSFESHARRLDPYGAELLFAIRALGHLVVRRNLKGNIIEVSICVMS